jgi:YidC/Oxa1 family membrane protein insertase
LSRKLKIISLFLGLMLVLSGCSTSTTHLKTTGELLQGGIWSHYFVFPLTWLLNTFADLAGGSYGIAILLLTIVIRFVILPLTLKQYKSSQAMQALQPEMKKIKDKYKDDPKRQQEETMRLFQKNNVNPMAGCFPILVQMPILFALYNSISWNKALYSHDFLWFQLGQPETTTIHFLAIIAALTTFVQQKVMMAMSPSQNMAQMKVLMYIFPVMILMMAWNFAAALPLYWIFSNTFTIVQTYFIYRKPKEGVVSK